MQNILHFLSHIHVLDIIIIVIILYALLIGYRKGIINIIFEVLSIFGSLFFAKILFPATSSFFAHILNLNISWIQVLIYILLVFIIFIVFRLLGILLTRIISYSFIDKYNNILGMLLNGFKIFCAIGITLLITGQIKSVKTNSFLNQSIVYNFIKNSAKTLQLDTKFTPRIKEMLHVTK